MTYPIVVYGHPVLKKVAADIDKKYPDLDKLIEDLFDTMYHSEGLGLAAPQIGKSIRLFVIDGAPVAEDEPELADFKKVFINAKIYKEEGEEWSFNEGCLSFPGLREDIMRKPVIYMRYVDEDFQPHDERFDGVIARVIQHEYDHIEGIVFVDRISTLKKMLLKGRLNDISKGNIEVDYKMLFPALKKTASPQRR
jgi:peptide deformylase